MTLFTKERVETLKTVTIAVLVTGIIAFIGGAKYQANQHNQVQVQAKSIVSSLKTQSR